jgi:hypothetical protein
MMIGPAPGCSTRKAGIGSLIQSSLEPKNFRATPSFPPGIAMNSTGESIRAQTIGCRTTVAPSRPPGSGFVRRLGSASATTRPLGA